MRRKSKTSTKTSTGSDSDAAEDIESTLTSSEEENGNNDDDYVQGEKSAKKRSTPTIKQRSSSSLTKPHSTTPSSNRKPGKASTTKVASTVTPNVENNQLNSIRKFLTIGGSSSRSTTPLPLIDSRNASEGITMVTHTGTTTTTNTTSSSSTVPPPRTEPIIHRPKVIYQDTDLKDIPSEFWKPITMDDILLIDERNNEETETIHATQKKEKKKNSTLMDTHGNNSNTEALWSLHQQQQEQQPPLFSSSESLLVPEVRQDIPLPLWIHAVQRSIQNLHWNIRSSVTAATDVLPASNPLLQHHASSFFLPSSSSSSSSPSSLSSLSATDSNLSAPVPWPSSFALLQEACANQTTETAYLIHLRFMIRTVYESPLTAHLWTNQEKRWIQYFLNLSPAAAGLFARMFQRKGPWFRTSSFQWYPELFAATLTQPAINIMNTDTDSNTLSTTVTSGGTNPSAFASSSNVTNDDTMWIDTLKNTNSNNNENSTDSEWETTDNEENEGNDLEEGTDKKDTFFTIPVSSSSTETTTLSSSSVPSSSTLMDEESLSNEATVVKPLTHDIHGHPSFNTGNRGRYTGIPRVLLGSTSNLRQLPTIKSLGYKEKRKATNNSSGRLSVPLHRILEAVQELRNAELIISLPYDPPASHRSSTVSRPGTVTNSLSSSSSNSSLPRHLEMYLEAIAYTLTVTEIKAIMQRLGININGKGALTVINNALASIKTSPGSITRSSSLGSSASSSSTDSQNIITNRLGLLIWLGYCVRTQRTVMGGYLPVEKALQYVLSSSSSSLTKFNDMKNSSSSSLSSSSESNRPLSFLIRALPAFQALLRRIHGIFYLVTGSSHLSTGSGTGTWPIGQEEETDDPNDDDEEEEQTNKENTMNRSNDPVILSHPSSSSSSSLSSSSCSVPLIPPSADASVVIIDDSDEEMLRPLDHRTVPPPRDPDRYLSPDSTVTLLPSFQSLHHNINPDLATLGSYGKQFFTVSSSYDRFASFGSGSRYADVTSTTETYVPTNLLGIMGNDNSTTMIDNANASINGGLFSPGLLQIFRKLDFPVYQPNQMKPLFTNRLDLQMFELAHVFRAQADVTGVYGNLMNPNNCIYEANNIVVTTVDRGTKKGSGSSSSSTGAPLDTRTVSPAVDPEDDGGRGSSSSSGSSSDEIEITEAPHTTASVSKRTRSSATASLSVFRNQEQISSSASSPSLDQKYPGLDWASCFRLLNFPWDTVPFVSSPPVPRTATGPKIPPTPPGTPIVRARTPILGIPKESTLPTSSSFSSVADVHRTGKLNQSFFTNETMISPPPLAGVALLPYALQLLGISPNHPSCQQYFTDTASYVRMYESSSEGDGTGTLPLLSRRPFMHQLIERIIYLIHRIPKTTLPLGPMVPNDAVGARSLYGILLECTKTPVMMHHLLSSLPDRLPYPSEDIAESIYTAPVALLTMYRASLCLAMQFHMVNPVTGLSPYAAYLTDPTGQRTTTTTLSSHPWLHQLCPGSLYATLLWEGIDPLERSRMYVHTIPYLVQLTSQGAVKRRTGNASESASSTASLLTVQTGSGRFTPHRSGRWWARLCLNISHMGLHGDAAACAEAGLFSPDVRGGDRLLVHDRAYRLRKKLLKIFGIVQKVYGLSHSRVHRAIVPGRVTNGKNDDEKGKVEEEEMDDEGIGDTTKETQAPTKPSTLSTAKKRKSTASPMKISVPSIEPSSSSSVAKRSSSTLPSNEEHHPRNSGVINLLDTTNVTTTDNETMDMEITVTSSTIIDNDTVTVETIIDPSMVSSASSSSSTLLSTVQTEILSTENTCPKIVSLRLAGPVTEKGGNSIGPAPLEGTIDSTNEKSKVLKEIGLTGEEHVSEDVLSILQAQVRLDNMYASKLGILSSQDTSSITNEPVDNEEENYRDPDMPSFGYIRATVNRYRENFRSKPIGKDTFVRQALNRAVGEKSRFVAMIDDDNDGTQETKTDKGGSIHEMVEDYTTVPPTPPRPTASSSASSSSSKKKTTSSSSAKSWWYRQNITDQICQVFGVTFPNGPQHYRYNPIDWVQRHQQELHRLFTEDDTDTMVVTSGSRSNPNSETPTGTTVVTSSSNPPGHGTTTTATTTTVNPTNHPPNSQPYDGLVNTSTLTVTIEDLSLMYYWIEGGNRQVHQYHSKASVLPYDEPNTVIPSDKPRTTNPKTIVMSAASGAGWRGIHCEGGPIRTLFAILMWDCLFGIPSQRIEGVFLTPYQDAPLDLDSPGVFYHNRLLSIRQRLIDIANFSPNELAKEIGRIWRKYYGQTCRGLRWDRYPLQLLQLIAMGFGSASIACICDAIAMDHKHLAGGMPDLLLWRITRLCKTAGTTMTTGGNGNESTVRMDSSMNTTMDGVLTGSVSSSSSSTTASGTLPAPDPHGPDVTGFLPADARIEVALIEVKSPRDILSEKQHVWLRILSTAGVNIGICKIVEQHTTGTKRKGKASKANEELSATATPAAATTKATLSKSGTKKSRTKTPAPRTKTSTSSSTTKSSSVPARSATTTPVPPSSTNPSPVDTRIVIDLMDDAEEEEEEEDNHNNKNKDQQKE